MIFEINNLSMDTIPPHESDIWGKPIKFESGQNYLLRAPSGTGKSTFISILFGLRKGYEGNVLIDNQDIKMMTSGDWSMLRSNKISIVFQDLRLFDSLTVYENLEIKRSLSSVEDRAQFYCEKLGIQSFLTKQVGKLSTGQKQRVAIARALSQPFEYILLDEPFSHLDPINLKLAADLIQDRCNELGAGIILTTLDKSPDLQFKQIYNL